MATTTKGGIPPGSIRHGRTDDPSASHLVTGKFRLSPFTAATDLLLLSLLLRLLLLRSGFWPRVYRTTVYGALYLDPVP
ncbi:hypothetical protein ASPCAL10454 [Aspergillus calidoustus]|uniref:Uncharacterized protein n=1 Tax=Aspergillus calidoustus TaxID=454130 RepID=A0A0U5CCA6_ASPCI|nr:hypothetical protein ASPCAL10454 [Aspergillus calidoustus]